MLVISLYYLDINTCRYMFIHTYVLSTHVYSVTTLSFNHVTYRWCRDIDNSFCRSELLDENEGLPKQRHTERISALELQDIQASRE